MTNRVREVPDGLPQLDATRCVHTKIETASCRACVDVCPRLAWQLDDEVLGLVVEACDGCGLCLPACPQQAIRLKLTFAYRQVASAHAVLAACAFSSANEGPGKLGCLSAIGLQTLLEHYQNGQHVWLLASGECDTCTRGKAESLPTRIEHLNTALRQRGRPVILPRRVSAPTWNRLQAETADSAPRRGFLRALTRHPGRLLSDSSALSTSNPPTDTPIAAGEWLPGDDGLLPWIIDLDPQRCIACHACARVCPQQAIHFEEIPPTYTLHQRACSGCRLCLDVCEHQAIRLTHWAQPQRASLALTAHRCRTCGVTFHAPAERTKPTQQCWICASSQPTRRLFQVMA